MRLDYKSVFNQRGNTYDEAMRRFPRARWTELENVFAHVDRSQIKSVLDIPSGGGYLSAHLPTDVTIDACDPSEPFAQAKNQPVDLESPSFPANSYDLAVCLAAVHHIHNKSRFLEGISHGVRPGGYIVIGDVQDSSRMAKFLDGFVGRHNGTGHDGEYLNGIPEKDFDWRPDTSELVACELLPCDWTLPTSSDLVTFCKLLFNVQGATDAQMCQAMEEEIGVEKQSDGTATLKWELLYYTFRRTMTE
jgi:SAM-dependent methyltransferase